MPEERRGDRPRCAAVSTTVRDNTQTRTTRKRLVRWDWSTSVICHIGMPSSSANQGVSVEYDTFRQKRPFAQESCTWLLMKCYPIVYVVLTHSQVVGWAKSSLPAHCMLTELLHTFICFVTASRGGTWSVS